MDARRLGAFDDLRDFNDIGRSIYPERPLLQGTEMAGRACTTGKRLGSPTQREAGPGEGETGRMGSGIYAAPSGRADADRGMGGNVGSEATTGEGKAERMGSEAGADPRERTRTRG